MIHHLDDFERGSPRSPFSYKPKLNQATNQPNYTQPTENSDIIKSPSRAALLIDKEKRLIEENASSPQETTQQNIVKKEERNSIPLINLNQSPEIKQNENVVNIDEIPIQSKKLTFEELLAKELENTSDKDVELINKTEIKQEGKTKILAPKEK